MLCRIASANSRAQLKEGIACDADAAVQMSNSTSGLLRGDYTEHAKGHLSGLVSVLCEYPRLQELVDSVVDCRYAECLTLIDELVNDLAYDPLIGHRAHVTSHFAAPLCEYISGDWTVCSYEVPHHSLQRLQRSPSATYSA